jgi:hypothetical protein
MATHLRHCCLLLFIVSGSELAAQDPRLAARLPADLAPRVQALVDSARQARLPTEPLIQKALEGQSKGADGPRILTAVRSLFGQLSQSRAALGENTAEADVVAGAACLKAGASPGMLSELRKLRPDQSLAVPLSVLSDLAATGVDMPNAWGAVRTVAMAKGPDADYLALRERMAATHQPPQGPAQPRLVPAPSGPAGP